MTRTAASANAKPAPSPSALPAAPINAASARSETTRRPRVTPSTRSNAKCGRLRSTASAWVEKTSKPPVNSATSAGRETCLRTVDDDARRQSPPEPIAKRFQVDAGLEAQIDAGDQAQPIEARLRAGDIHHGEALLLAARNESRDDEGRVAQGDLEAYRSAGSEIEPVRRGRA